MSSPPENYRKAEIHLLEGDAAGCCECAPRYWTGTAFRIPRSLLEKNKDGTRKKLEKACDELKGGGIYFLFGRTKVEGGESKKCVYVGKGGHYEDNSGEETGVLRRVMQNHRGSIDKDWDEVVVVVSDNKDKRPLDIDALEKKFIDRISETLDTAEWVLRNENRPRPVRKPDSELDRFVEYANIALRAFGYCVLENLNRKPPVDPVSPPEPPKPPPNNWLLHMKYGKGEAKGKLTSDGFVVLAGSKINPNTTRTCRNITIRYREECADKIRDNTLISDIPFKSASAAASFVAGADISGNMHWRDDAGILLGKLLSGKSVSRQSSTGDGRLLHLAYTPKAIDKTYTASGKYISDKEFILIKGSEFCPVEIPKCRDDVRKIRRRHADKIIDGRLVSDIQFGSSSTAASFVCGAQRNGYTSWCDPQSKKTLGELLEESQKN